ncbi:hypothetical protein J437_LFUL016329 [Ladona fulva]|uniref:Uncharacterized protein n=1 Tax=Ladona fulva TaxID=123851 RepID=A0A8K0KL61_LADFU|nr:hypothetical protein J437_LFUL016329 [Ladona fulva]
MAHCITILHFLSDWEKRISQIYSFAEGAITVPHRYYSHRDHSLSVGVGDQGILTAVLSAVLGSKDPDQVSTMAKQAGEFINIVVNLLDALKTSFSHRSMAARSIGKKDSISDAAVAGLSLLKGYVRTLKTNNDACIQKFVCEANRECSRDIQGSGFLYCQLGTSYDFRKIYATSYLLEKTNTSPFETYYEAGRRGRSGDECHLVYQQCNEV